MKVAIAVVAMVLVSGVAQGQILRWDNGQPIPGTEFVDPVRYAAGDLTGYGFGNIDLSFADLSGRNLAGTQWQWNQGYNLDLRGTTWSGQYRLPDNLSMVDMRGASYPSTGNPVWLFNATGVASDGEIRWGSSNYGPGWLTVFNGGPAPHLEGNLLRSAGVWPVLDGGDWQQPISLAAYQLSATPRPFEFFENRLRISFRHDSQVTAGKTYDLFDWPYGVKNQFASVEVPDGSKWDLTKLYTTGEARLIEWPETSPTEFRKFYQSDLDLDGDVDSADLLSVLQGWTGADYQGPAVGVDHGDLDADSDVDSGDLLVMMGQWTGALAASRAAVVPEPSGLVLGIVGLLVVMRRGRR